MTKCDFCGYYDVNKQRCSWSGLARLPYCERAVDKMVKALKGEKRSRDYNE